MNPLELPTGWRQLRPNERVEHGDWFYASPGWLRCAYVGQAVAYYRGADIIRRTDPAAPVNPNEVRQ